MEKSGTKKTKPGKPGKTEPLNKKDEKSVRDAIKELKAAVKNMGNVAGVMREESLYIMDKIRKDSAAKELLPHYKLILDIFKRSNVFISQDMHNVFVEKLNETLRALDVKLNELNGTVDALKGIPFVGLCPQGLHTAMMADIGPRIDDETGKNFGRRVKCLSCGTETVFTEDKVKDLQKETAERMAKVLKNGGKKNGICKIFGRFRRQ